MMQEWQQHYVDNVGKDKLFPVLIPQPTTKRTSKKSPMPTDIPKSARKKEEEFIQLYWNGATIHYGHGSLVPQFLKCTQCWANGVLPDRLCYRHGSSVTYHFALLRDKSETNTKYHATVYQKALKRKEWTNEYVKGSAKIRTLVLLSSYLSSHPNADFTDEIFHEILTFICPRSYYAHG